MAATGNQTSLRKRDLTTQKSPAVAYNALVFQHKAAAGETGINLAALNTPTEASSNGFVQPSAQRLAEAQLKRNSNVLKLISSSGAVLQPYVSFRVTGNLQIQFIGFTALQDEIFTGYIDPVAVTGATIADISAEPITGTLAASTTDINVGYQFKVNLHSSQQVGQYSLELDGVGQFRNENNASTGTGNYYEVDNGDGTGTLMRVNTAVAYERSYKLIPIGSVLERPAGSVLQAIDQQNGVIQKLVEVVADLSGLERTGLTASPTSPDLSAFGNRVLAVEQNRARVDQSNTWTTPQALVGMTDGSTPASDQIGHKVSVNLTTNPITTVADTYVDAGGTLTIPAGYWMVGYCVTAGVTKTSANASAAINAELVMRDSGDNTAVTDMRAYMEAQGAGSTVSGFYGTFTKITFLNLTAAKTVKMSIRCAQATANGQAQILGTADITGGLSGSDNSATMWCVRIK